MARSTMATLITFVRRKIFDPAGQSQLFSDDDIQAELDATRLDVAPYEVLIPMYSYSGGLLVYLDHYSRYSFWEDGAELRDAGNNLLTASTTEPLREPDADGKAAHFQFATTQIVVRAKGHSYDVWQVAANLLEEKVGSQSTVNVSFNANGQGFQLGQITQTWLKLVDSYRAKQRIGTVATYRDDVQSEVEYQRRRRIGIVNADTPFLTGQ